jgi:hypothetical protein
MSTFNYGQFPFADLILSQRIAYDGGGNAEYIGYAAPGSCETEPKWMIAKFIYSGASVIAKVWADGTNFQDKAWNNRANYNYS